MSHAEEEMLRALGAGLDLIHKAMTPAQPVQVLDSKFAPRKGEEDRLQEAKSNS
jgi:hypothetical protein